MQGKSVEILYFFAVVFVRADPGPHLVMLSEVETSLSSRASCVHGIAVSVETPSASLVPLNQEGQFFIFIPRLLGGRTPPLRLVLLFALL